MKNKFFIIFIIISLLALSRCANKVKRTIKGVWSIDSLFYNEIDLRHCLNGNIIIFEESDVELPVTKDYCPDIIVTFQRKGKWELIENDSGLNVNFMGNNKIFSGSHTITFKKDSLNKLLKMEIVSDSLYVLCRKGLYDYNRNLKSIEKLVEKTN